MDFDNLDNIDFEKAEESTQQRIEELDNEVAEEAVNDCGNGGCII